MYPAHTVFRLARAGGEFNKLYAIARRNGTPLPAGTLNFPTVLAEREGKVIGFLSTIKASQSIGVCAGPLMLAKGPNMLLAIRLAEAYEVLLRKVGVKEYFHTVEKTRSEYIGMLERLGYTKQHEMDTHIVMQRKLQ